MYSVSPGEIPNKKFYGLLASSVVPRPIALASTISKDGVPNLTPFSCFNFFGSNPPILVISPMRRISDSTTKDSLNNIEDIKEVVINVVNHAMVHQSSLASTDYPSAVNEFEKAGFTMLDADLVTPKRVAESPVQYECKVNDIIYTGTGGGAANLVICEILKIHIADEVLYDGTKIDQHKLDAVGRMGGSWYSRANQGMFELPKPIGIIGIGFDQLPQDIKTSTILTGNDLAKLAGVEEIPDENTIHQYILQNNLEDFINNSTIEKIHLQAQQYLEKNEIFEAWSILLAKTVKTI